MSLDARLEVNGQTREYLSKAMPANVYELLESLGLDPPGVVVEVNGDLVKRSDFAKMPLVNGDTVEVVRLVGGG